MHERSLPAYFGGGGGGKVYQFGVGRGCATKCYRHCFALILESNKPNKNYTLLLHVV